MITVLLVVCLFASSAPVQFTFTVEELAQYRLSLGVFEQFVRASTLIAAATRDDPGLAARPLFTREVLLDGDAPIVAAELATRLHGEPRFAAALREAGISAHDYTRFALSLTAARLAHGFVSSGAIRRVPAGVATDNVAFVEAHHAEVSAVLKVLGIEEPILHARAQQRGRALDFSCARSERWIRGSCRDRTSTDRIDPSDCRRPRV
jgi:hypothetical protein